MIERLKAAWAAFKNPAVPVPDLIPAPESCPQLSVILPLHHCGHRDARWAVNPKTGMTVCLPCYMLYNYYIPKDLKPKPRGV